MIDCGPLTNDGFRGCDGLLFNHLPFEFLKV